MSADPSNPASLASLIDHTILRPDARADEVALHCEEALVHRFCSVCVNPIYVPQVAAHLSGSGVLTCSVICFPFGATATAAKAHEAGWVVANGAQEVDMVIAVGALKDRHYDDVRTDIAAVKAACGDAVLKVIIETCLLADDEKVIACRLSEEAGADFVKTSTGFAGGGATAEDIRLMRRTVGPRLGVKASGGIRTRGDALKMIEAGASRIGASSGVALISK